MVKYPSKIDTSTSLPIVVDNVTSVQASVFNKLRDAIIAVEEELGVKPSASYSTVRARLDSLETIIGNLQIIELDGDLGGTLDIPKVIGIQGNPVSDEVPGFNDVLTWNGIAWIPANTTGGTIGPTGPSGPTGPTGPTGPQSAITPIYALTGAANTLALVHESGFVTVSHTSLTQLTVPNNSTIPFTVGCIISVQQIGAGPLEILAAGGVTISYPSTYVAFAGEQYSVISLFKTGTNTWTLLGDLALA